ncbi:hypothetical protein HLB27_09135 [Dickeya dadantii]|uniref:hypothetical protein n=1 Tax=Dickeya dadantii TaxID=204038 RepID=UPI00149617C1|nr:hypothetical protein [Dickeya dadantii]NPE61243.1 hypothetical protein [Dickeya dadantii]NPE70795.1 hypothetical protein [Dickeya dadantii]
MTRSIPASALRRTLIMGNSGSGKSWLAEQLAARLQAPAIDLDLINWEPGGYGQARERELVKAEARELAQAECWIMEGVYGWLMQEVVQQATALIWLDIPVDECLNNIRQRGLRRGGDEAALAELLRWAGEYRERQSNSSFSGHQRVFEQCVPEAPSQRMVVPQRMVVSQRMVVPQRIMLHSREDIERFMAGILSDD